MGRRCTGIEPARNDFTSSSDQAVTQAIAVLLSAKARSETQPGELLQLIRKLVEYGNVLKLVGQCPNGQSRTSAD